MIAEFRLLFHGWPDVYFDGDMGGAFLVRFAFREPRYTGDRHDLCNLKESSPLASQTAGLRGLSMALSSAGLAPSACTAPLPRWRLRKFSIRVKVISAHGGNCRVPLAGGQYSMVSEYAPPGATNFLSYITGKRSHKNWSGRTAVADISQAGSPALAGKLRLRVPGI